MAKRLVTRTIPRLRPIKEMAHASGIPYTSLRDAALRGDLPIVKIGRAWYIDDQDFARFIQQAKHQRISVR